jgi:HEPN domain-containing protein
MTNLDLAAGYLTKATKRLKILDVLLAEDDFSDIVREAQEIVELSQKAMLRRVGIDPPKWHDVGGIILEHQERFSQDVRARLARCAEISKRLRKERELSFYGDIDFIPTEEYSRADAEQCIADARFVVELAQKAVGPVKT